MMAIQQIIAAVKSLFSKNGETHPEFTVITAPPQAHFQVIRGGEVSSRIATFDEVAEFLGDCHFEQDSAHFEAALAGVPFEIDGATMRFVRLPDGFTPPKD